MEILYALILFGLFNSAYSKAKFCNEIETVPVNFTKFVGVWHGVEYHPAVTSPKICPVHNYTIVENKFYRLNAFCVLGFDKSTYQYTAPCDTLHTYMHSGDAVQKRPRHHHLRRRERVRTSVVPKIVGTDEESFYVEYICSERFPSDIYVEIHTRDANPPSFVLEEAYEVLNKHGLSSSAMLKYDHANCERYELYRQLHSK